MSTGEPRERPGTYRPTVADGEFILEVDGEIFTVRIPPEDPHSVDYTWVSGPNEGYGFSGTQYVAFFSVLDKAITPTPIPPHTVDEHRESIRDFLRGINPETGYLGD